MHKTITEYRTEWEDCTMLIHCPYCDRELYLDSQNEPKQCDCGHVFYLSSDIIEICTTPTYTEKEILS